MRKRIASFVNGGLHWECYIDNAKTQAGKRLYIIDRDNLEIHVTDDIAGYKAIPDKVVEHMLKGIVSMTLTMIGEKELIVDSFITPFASFLFQFIKTDNFDGDNGTFSLGGSQWIVYNDKTYTFHRDINGECDFNTGKIILELYDNETMLRRKVAYVRSVYLHEVVHAILGQMGFEHEEKLVRVLGHVLYETINSLRLVYGNKEKNFWPVKSKTSKK